jgi:predicted negative regulator of RcsB-dependent stress response
MADLHLTEDEQTERLKQWWKENGTSVIAGAVLGIAVIGGVNYWRIYKNEQAESAAGLYEQVLQSQGNPESTAIGQRLIDEYSSTPYAGKAALVLGSTAFENENPDQARMHFEWALENAPDPADRKLARLRLARVELGRQELDKVEQLLAGIPGGGYESEYRELLGDLAMARNDPETAREEYRAALDTLPEQSGFAEMLNIKLDAAIGASR